MPEFVDAETAAGLIQDGDAVLFGGSGGGHAVPEAVIEALARRFLEDGAPRDLTLISVVSLGDWQTTGFNLLAEPGLARRVISARLQQLPEVRRAGARRPDRGLDAAPGHALAADARHGGGPAWACSRRPGCTPSSTRAMAAAGRARAASRTWSSC